MILDIESTLVVKLNIELFFGLSIDDAVDRVLASDVFRCGSLRSQCLLGHVLGGGAALSGAWGCRTRRNPKVRDTRSRSSASFPYPSCPRRIEPPWLPRVLAWWPSPQDSSTSKGQRQQCETMPD